MVQEEGSDRKNDGIETPHGIEKVVLGHHIDQFVICRKGIEEREGIRHIYTQYSQLHYVHNPPIKRGKVVHNMNHIVVGFKYPQE